MDSSEKNRRESTKLAHLTEEERIEHRREQKNKSKKQRAGNSRSWTRLTSLTEAERKDRLNKQKEESRQRKKAPQSNQYINMEETKNQNEAFKQNENPSEEQDDVLETPPPPANAEFIEASLRTFPEREVEREAKNEKEDLSELKAFYREDEGLTSTLLRKI